MPSARSEPDELSTSRGASRRQWDFSSDVKRPLHECHALGCPCISLFLGNMIRLVPLAQHCRHWEPLPPPPPKKKKEKKEQASALQSAMPPQDAPLAEVQGVMRVVHSGPLLFFSRPIAASKNRAVPVRPRRLSDSPMFCHGALTRHCTWSPPLTRTLNAFSEFLLGHNADVLVGLVSKRQSFVLSGGSHRPHSQIVVDWICMIISLLWGTSPGFCRHLSHILLICR